MTPPNAPNAGLFGHVSSANEMLVNSEANSILPTPPQHIQPPQSPVLPIGGSVENQKPARQSTEADARQDGSSRLTFVSNSAVQHTPTLPPKGKRSASASPFRLAMPLITPGQLAFSALQFLPVPVLVLNNLKTVVLANEAMGTMLGMVNDSPGRRQEDVMTVSDKLRGQTLPQVGIDMMQDGRPVWISWEPFLDELVAEIGPKQSCNASSSYHGSDASSSTLPVHVPDGNVPDGGVFDKPNRPDSAVDVVVTSKCFEKNSMSNSRASEYRTYAKMIISIWEIENHQTYYTLTFTHTETSPSSVPGPRIAVARPATLDAAERKTIVSNPPSVSSSHDGSSPSFLLNPGSVSVSSSPFPPMGPPSRLPQTRTPSALQKMTVIKDALLDNTDMPILAMWKDGSAPVANRAARDLFRDTSGMDDTDGIDLLSKWDVWNEDFTRKYDEAEFPMSLLLREQKPFASMRVGMLNKITNSRVIFDVLGELITDDETGEFVAGVITCRDVTRMAQEITQFKELDSERFKLICDTMPQMVWTTTPDGSHDFYNTRWYDYTGLAPEDSLGLGWKHPFHPDDMPATLRRWKHSLATGDPYKTEYRCQSKTGEWRWMLGRALPLRNKQTGKIEKWFGTCTDIHEAMEAQMAAKQTRDQLQQVLRHAQTTIFSVDRDRKVTMLEGALISDGDKDTFTEDGAATDSQRYLGRNVDEVFNDLNPRLRRGEIPAFLKPVKDVLDGKDAQDIVHEHGIGRPEHCSSPLISV
jgi:PAS domain S-box-containing protein